MFPDETYVDDCNKLGEDITENLINGLSVYDAIKNIDYVDYNENMFDIAVIAGNQYNRLR